jgi:hypothetical protein
MTPSLWKRVAKKTEWVVWGGVATILGLFGFSTYLLPRMIAAWTARGGDVAPWIVQVPIDARYMIHRPQFSIFPILLWALWTSVWARSRYVR